MGANLILNMQKILLVVFFLIISVAYAQQSHPASEIATNSNERNSNLNLGTYSLFANVIGIGTTAPGEKLAIYGESASIRLKGTTPDYKLGLNEADNYFLISRTGILNDFVLRGGNVGIGTSTPSSKLQVNGILDVSSNRITSVLAPIASTDAANRQYVDDKVAASNSNLDVPVSSRSARTTSKTYAGGYVASQSYDPSVSNGWVQLTSSTQSAIEIYQVLISVNYAGGDHEAFVQLATGPAGSESVIAKFDLPVTGTDQVFPIVLTEAIYVPSGTRLSMRTGGTVSGTLSVYPQYRT